MFSSHGPCVEEQIADARRGRGATNLRAIVEFAALARPAEDGASIRAGRSAG
jgi:hypothetical protein